MSLETREKSITLNLTDLSTGVEHHGDLKNSKSANFNFMVATLDVDRSKLERAIMDAIDIYMEPFKEKYELLPKDAIKLYVDKSNNPDRDSEIFLDATINHYPLRDYYGMLNEMHNIIRDYDKLGKRNSYAIEHGRLSKHMMHLIRLFLMGIDILEKDYML